MFRITKITKITEFLTHWGWATHICVSKLTTICSENGLLPGRCQATIWTNAGILFIGPLGTNFSEILIEIHTFLFKKMHLKMSSAKWHTFCLSPNVLMYGLLCQETICNWWLPCENCQLYETCFNIMMSSYKLVQSLILRHSNWLWLRWNYYSFVKYKWVL